MLKKIYGDCCVEILCNPTEAVLSPLAKTEFALCFKNETEYDMPLSVEMKLPFGVKCGKGVFDITVPAYGSITDSIFLALGKEDLMYCGNSVVELCVCDRVLETKAVFEMPIFCEMSYKCQNDEEEIFRAEDEAVFSRQGVFYGACREILSIEFAATDDLCVNLCVLSGSLEKVTLCDRELDSLSNIEITKGVCRFWAYAAEDVSFCFCDVQSGEKIFINTINVKHFLEV